MEVEDSEEDEPAPGFNMAEEDAEFAAAQAEEMAEQHTIIESIQDEVKVEANRELIWWKQAEADMLFDELDAEIPAEEAGADHSEGAELQLLRWYPLKGMEIVNISNTE
ncbi:Cysteinyl-tRNA synthetase [Hordeum vulgare]|nr:Cysteinyl-tRNA synthetase [Hordeum vulgare]